MARLYVTQCHFQGIQHTHGTGCYLVQVVANRMLQHGHIDDAVAACNPDTLTEITNRSGSEPPASHAGQGRHARIIPAADHARFNHFFEIALAHHGVIQPQLGKFCLLRKHIVEIRICQIAGCTQAMNIEIVQYPVVQRAMIFEFQGAQGMGDIFDRIRDAMAVVVGRIYAPRAAGLVVLDMTNSVQHRVSHIDVR